MKRERHREDMNVTGLKVLLRLASGSYKEK